MKKAVLHATTQMHCKAGQVLRDLFSTNQGNGSEMTFVAGATKINFKNLKTQLLAVNYFHKKLYRRCLTEL